MAVEPRRIEKLEFKRPEFQKERPLIAPRDVAVHRYINSSNGLAEIRRLKSVLDLALRAKSRPDRKIMVKLQEQLEAIESEFNDIRRGVEVPPKYDLTTRQITLRAIRQILLRKKLVADQ
ncbi:MAG: hypothetical protein PHH82_03155 [Candidatus ainarchaeum sp.]|nr:hypothetical protein [Candidatus ainarchaeum sp.]